jgi:hypothetical protein
MQAIKLTPKEREVFEHLKSLPGGKLRQHVKFSNTICFRLLDKEMNPVANYRYGIIHSLIDKNILELDGHDYVLKATSDISK